MSPDLSSLPQGITEAEDLLDGLDQCWSIGLSRLADAERAALGNFVQAFARTPLAEPLADALNGILAAEFKPERLLQIAIARASLQASIHDALAKQLEAACGIKGSPSTHVPRLRPLSKEAATIASGAQQWLAELAIVGFGNLQPAQITSFASNLETLQVAQGSGRAAALLTGFLGELLDASPIHDSASIPQRRWADLWTRAMLLISHPVDEDLSQTEVTGGVFTPIGLDVRAHGHFVRLMAHGCLKPKTGETRWVVWTAQRYKVDVIDGHEIWALFQPEIDPVLEAIENGASLSIEKGTVSAEGMISFEKPTVTGNGVDLAGVVRDVATQSLPVTDVYTRHPIHLACPVLVEGESSLPILKETVPPWSELQSLLNKPKTVAGLLRYDQRRWNLQPLALFGAVPPPPESSKKKSKPAKKAATEGWVRTGMHGRTALKVHPPETMEILAERASKMLRAS